MRPLRAYQILNRWDEYRSLRIDGWKLVQAKKLAPGDLSVILTNETPSGRSYRVFLVKHDTTTDETTGVYVTNKTSLVEALDKVSQQRAAYKHLAFIERISRT